MVLAGLGIALAAVVASVVIIWRRQQLLAQQLEALCARLDQVRLDVAHLRSPHGRRVRHRTARRKRHLQLLQGTGMLTAAGAAWVRGHRAATFVGLAVVVAAVAVLTAARANAVKDGAPGPDRTQALELVLPLEEARPTTAGTCPRQPAVPGPTTAAPPAAAPAGVRPPAPDRAGAEHPVQQLLDAFHDQARRMFDPPLVLPNRG
ncbi:hypothetical protein ACF08A_25820 [Streptomyces cellulosae]